MSTLQKGERESLFVSNYCMLIFYDTPQSTLWTAYVRDICEKANNSLFYSPLTMQLCMQRYGHKSYDVIRKSPNVDIFTTTIAKQQNMTDKKKVKIIKSFLLHHYEFLWQQQRWEGQGKKRLRTIFYVSLHHSISSTTAIHSATINDNKWVGKYTAVKITRKIIKKWVFRY